MKVSFSLLSHSHADRLPAQVSSQGPLLAVWVGDGSLASILSYLVESTLSKHFVSLLGWHVFCHTHRNTQDTCHLFVCSLANGWAPIPGIGQGTRDASPRVAHETLLALGVPTLFWH